MREAFENSLLANPDDIAGWCAYADYLAEQGDPRGEFMQTQLALEDESRPKVERDALKWSELELLTAHEREWLGELAQHITRGNYSWRRGVLSVLNLSELTMSMAQLLATTPTARFLSELRIAQTAAHRQEEMQGALEPRVPLPTGVPSYYPPFELIGAPCLQNVRIFWLGDEDPPEDSWGDCHTYVEGLEHVIACMPRIEELHLLCKGFETAPLFALPNFTHLRVLRLYHLGGYGYRRRYEYALDVLAANPMFRNLTHLQFHPHWAEQGDGGGGDVSYIPLGQVHALVRSPNLPKLTHLQLRLSDMGDDGIREIIASGILKRLKWLDLRHGCITDEGARLLAACPDAKQLERLDLSRNAVTATGLLNLRNANINAVANDPLTPAELDDRQYLREGDFE